MNIAFRLVVLALVPTAYAATPPLQEPNPPQLSVRLATAKILPGSTVKGTAVVAIQEGFHAYQNPPRNDYEIPLKLGSATKGVSLKPSYPKGAAIEFMGSQTDAYEGSVTIPFTFVAPKKPGAYALRIEAGYQLCNDTNCWPPGTVATTVRYVVVKK